MSREQLHRYAEALDELIKFGDYLWRQGGHVPGRGVARKLRDIAKQALGEDMPNYSRGFNYYDSEQEMRDEAANPNVYKPEDGHAFAVSEYPTPRAQGLCHWCGHVENTHLSEQETQQ